jgi:hypothetical protein
MVVKELARNVVKNLPVFTKDSTDCSQNIKNIKKNTTRNPFAKNLT